MNPIRILLIGDSLLCEGVRTALSVQPGFQVQHMTEFKQSIRPFDIAIMDALQARYHAGELSRSHPQAPLLTLNWSHPEQVQIQLNCENALDRDGLTRLLLLLRNFSASDESLEKPVHPD